MCKADHELRYGNAVFTNESCVVRMKQEGGIVTFRVFKKDSLGEMPAPDLYYENSGDVQFKAFWHVKV